LKLGRHPIIAVSAIVQSTSGAIALVKRLIEPGAGKWALPGGLVNYNETVEEALVREVKEEIGLDVEIERLVGVYDIIKKDRYHYVTICFLTKNVEEVELKPGYDVGGAKWFSIGELSKCTLTKTTSRIFRHVRMLQ
jgi:8-oxo-dGTP diphosphatase